MKTQPTTPTALLVLLLSLSSTLPSKGYGLNISSVEDFYEFTENVNNGTSNYAGKTVFLTNDLDMTGYASSFAPIGNSDTNTFRGTFDGQGHTISNLKVSSGEFRFLGIFGYSLGTTIKNIVMDGSCSFVDSFSSDSMGSALGGVLGWCDSGEGECVVEGCVNMAFIRHTGINEETVYLGGITGKFFPVNYSTSIINCVNYGDIISKAPYLFHIRAGGIIGELWTYDNSVTFSNSIRNCVNFGTISQTGAIRRNMYVGGISGIDEPNILFENCVNFGTISFNESESSSVRASAISGVSTWGNFTNCFWDSTIGLNFTGTISNNSQEGFVEAFNTTSITNPTVLDILKGTGNIEFAILNLDSRGGSAVGPILVILNDASMKDIGPLPIPVREESTFDGWYNDTDLTKKFNTNELNAGNLTLYARWVINKYSITFIVDKTRNETLQEFGANISFPEDPTKEGFTFARWNNTLTTVPSHNATIEALWVINNYTITFIVDEKEYNKVIQEFDSNVSFPEDLTKEGFTFDGWYRDSAFKSKANNNVTVSGNTTLYGRFISTIITIEFNTNEMSTKEVAKEIEKIAGCTDCFTISKIEEERGKAIIIIKFNDMNEATSFIDAVQK